MQSTPSHLDAVLRQMDAASAKFQSAEAEVRRDIFTKIVNDTDHQNGEIYFLRAGSGMQMGMKMVTPPQVFEYKNGVARRYDPSANHIDEFSQTGENKGRMDTFLTLGFGGSGKELERAWTITDLGPEQMKQGDKTVDAEKLDLISKDAAAKKNFTHVTIWIDPVRDVSVEQKFFLPNGDTQTAFYANIRLNQKIDVGQFAIKCKGRCG